MRASLMALMWIAMGFTAALGQQFQTAFKERSHDFGTVARSAKTEHRFYFENPYTTPIHVRSVRTSCGCTTPSILTETVEPGQSGCILAVFNTATHTGSRGATITVTFDKPSFSEVQLTVRGYIRSDVVFNPNEVGFGKLSEGTAKEVDVTLDYVGKSTWQVTHATSDLPYVKIAIQEQLRQGGKVRYGLKVTLDETAPAGPLQSEIALHTNDLNIKSLSLGLSANVEPSLSIQPNLFSLGSIGKQEEIKKLVRLKATESFRILGISSEDFDVSSTKLPEESKDMHLLSLVFAPKSAALSDKKSNSEQRGKIVVLTDLATKPRAELDVVYRLKDNVVPLSASVK